MEEGASRILLCVDRTSRQAGLRSAAFDFMFVYWYLIRFVGHSPFSHSALDIKTFAMAMLRKGYRQSAKSGMPSR